jgi:hypothetical protein
LWRWFVQNRSKVIIFTAAKYELWLIAIAVKMNKPPRPELSRGGLFIYAGIAALSVF